MDETSYVGEVPIMSHGGGGGHHLHRPVTKLGEQGGKTKLRGAKYKLLNRGLAMPEERRGKPRSREDWTPNAPFVTGLHQPLLNPTSPHFHNFIRTKHLHGLMITYKVG